MDDVVNATIENVKMYDFQNNSSYFNSASNQLNDDSWGVNGSNRCKEITFNNCVLNRIDAHRGIYNLTVKNSILGRYGIHVVGKGNLEIEKVQAWYTNEFIVLRPDYGSTWDGKVFVKDSDIYPSNNDNVYLIKFRVIYDETNENQNKGYVHDYGYDLHLPKVSVDTLRVHSKASKFAIYKNNKYSTYNGNLKIYNSGGDLSQINSKIKNGSFSYTYPDSSKKEDMSLENVTGENSSFKAYKFDQNFKKF